MKGPKPGKILHLHTAGICEQIKKPMSCIILYMITHDGHLKTQGKLIIK